MTLSHYNYKIDFTDNPLGIDGFAKSNAIQRAAIIARQLDIYNYIVTQCDSNGSYHVYEAIRKTLEEEF